MKTRTRISAREAIVLGGDVSAEVEKQLDFLQDKSPRYNPNIARLALLRLREDKNFAYVFYSQFFPRSYARLS